MSSTGSTGRPAAGPTAQPIDDPRTGEIIKGSVLLGSLRARQDMMIFQALVGAGLTGTGDPNDPITATLARIRQLGAHEVGHAIGLAHNFAASTQGRYSVMDYPAPRDHARRAGRRRSRMPTASASGRGTSGSIKWLYGAQDRRRSRADRSAQARAQGLRFVADNDSRPVSSGNPEGALVGRRRRPDRRAAADDGGAAGRGRSASAAARSPPASRSPICAARSFRSGCSTATRSRRRPSRVGGVELPLCAQRRSR